MRAILCEELGGPEKLVLRELPDPEPRRGEVLIDVEACGVNFPDLLILQGLYQIRPPLPFSPGGEVAGTIAKVGEGVSGVSVGDRVLALTFYGGFVSPMVVPAPQVTKLPSSMDTRVAGGFGFTYATSLHALKHRAQLREGETLLVLGAAGGVGLAAVEIGAAMGARVIAAASTREKLELCRAHGASEGILYTEEDLKERIKQLGGADVVYDPVGGPYSEPALRGLKLFGRHLVIGFAAGEIPAIRLNLALLKQCSIVGVAWGAWAMQHRDEQAALLRELFAMFERGALRPHVHEVYPLEDAPRALADLAARRVRGKAILVP
jgi:NADPH2:quinone reductase